MTERPKPYVGISGIVTVGQQIELTNYFDEQNIEDKRRLAFGVKAVHKTQFLDIPNKYGVSWYPVGWDGFHDALGRNTLGDNLGVAQVCFDEDYVSIPKYRKEFVERICGRHRGWLNAIQFDMLPWHEDETVLPWLERLKDETNLTILLQAHGEAMSELGPDGVARKLGRYAHALDYVLFDASHGKGVRMNKKALLPFLNISHASSSLEHVGMGIAGGLNAEVVREELPAILEYYPDISWDAEGQLHPAQPDGARPIDMPLTTEYLNASAEVLREV